MNISIQKPFSISECGKSIAHEDALFPQKERVSINDRLFLVCCGIGSSNKKERAGSLVCNSVRTYFNTFLDPERDFSSDFIRKAVCYAEICLDDALINHPLKKVKCSLSLLYIARDGIYLAYTGDCGVYQFRNGKIVFRTEYKYNHITTGSENRYIQGSERPAVVEILKITDIRPEDCFMMCTGSVKEAIPGDEMEELFSCEESYAEKTARIREICELRSVNNYSAYLIPIQETGKINVFKQVMTSILYAFV